MLVSEFESFRKVTIKIYFVRNEDATDNIITMLRIEDQEHFRRSRIEDQEP